MTLSSASDLDRARALVSDARRVLVLTGAGISHESGVPTFRGPGGLWRDFRPEELATPRAFARDPRLVWEWYDWRRRTVAACRPNAAHHALARLAARRAGVRIVTQNVDGLHQRAADAVASPTGDGPSPAAPLELHGSLFRVRCTRCDWSARHDEPIDTTDEDSLPRCPRCGALARPAVVWFGEALDPVVLESAWRTAAEADLCLVVGTSALVHPAAALPLVTRDHGGAVVEVNPEPTPLSAHATVSLRLGAVAAVPPVVGEDGAEAAPAGGQA